MCLFIECVRGLNIEIILLPSDSDVITWCGCVQRERCDSRCAKYIAGQPDGLLLSLYLCRVLINLIQVLFAV